MKSQGAMRWILRAGLRLPILISPFLLRIKLFPSRPPAHPQVMRPGETLADTHIPEPLLPFDFLLSPLTSLRRRLNKTPATAPVPLDFKQPSPETK